jgi:hypothetical protein
MTRCAIVIAICWQLAVGGIPPALEEAGEIAAGVVEGFLGASDIKACVQKTISSVDGIEEAIHDFEQKDAADILKGLKVLAQSLKQLPSALADCKAVESDVQSLVNALKSMGSPSQFAYHAAKDLLVNGAYHLP